MIWPRSCLRCREDLASHSGRCRRFLSRIQWGAILSKFQDATFLDSPALAFTQRGLKSRESALKVSPPRGRYSVISSHILGRNGGA